MRVSEMIFWGEGKGLSRRGVKCIVVDVEGV